MEVEVEPPVQEAPVPPRANVGREHLLTRLRRLRSSRALRSLVRETRLDLDSLIYPLFVGPTTQPNEALPALGGFSVDDLVAEAEELAVSACPP